MVSLGLYTLLFTLFSIGCKAFIPAYPTNDTQAAINAGINLEDGSTIDIKWFDKGTFLAPVSYQYPGQGSTGLVKGAFVQFTEQSGIEATSTPWIALISCDANSTDASLDQDIFTYAHSKGAVGALLYSLYSTTCILTSYPDPNPIDIFLSTKDSVSRIIQSTFLNLKDPSLVNFDGGRLTSNAAFVNQSLGSGAPREAGYLITWLIAHNATFDTSYTLGGALWSSIYTELPTSASSASQAQVTGSGASAQGSSNAAFRFDAPLTLNLTIFLLTLCLCFGL